MKYLYLFSILISQMTFSQTLCDHNVSTDPTNPTNDALPFGTTSYQSRFKNHFDWLLKEIDPSGTPLGLIDLPFVNGSYAGLVSGNMSSIMINSLDEYDYLTRGPLPLTKNGWELLLLNLGTYPDNTTPLLNTIPALPYIVLYNRYSGTMRVYVNYGLDKGVANKADAMSISLKFKSDLYSGILRLYEGNDQALDQKTDIQKASTVCKNPALGKQWASCDFKIAYDPCTCFYKTELKLDFSQTSSSTLALEGRSITMPNQSLVDPNLTYNPNEFLSGWDGSSSVDNSTSGFALEKNITNLISNYKDQYNDYNNKLVAANEHNKKVKINLSILKLATFVAGAVVAGPAVIGSFIPVETPEMAMMAMELAATEKTGLTAEQITAAYGNLGLIPENEIDFFKLVELGEQGIIKINAEGAKIIDQNALFGHVKKIFGEKGKLFIANNFEAQELPSAPSIPTATFSEMKYSGTITNTLDIGGPVFYSPGTYGSSSFPATNIDNTLMYPIYNDVLGTFALLKSPKVKITKLLQTSPEENIIKQNTTTTSFNSYSLKMQRYQSWTKQIQIKLDEDLKFAINDVIDVKKYAIQASFKIVATPKVINSSPNTVINCFIDPAKMVNFTSNNADLSKYSKVYARDNPYHYNYNNPDFDYNTYGIGNVAIIPPTPDTIELQTPYLPIDAFKPLTSVIGIRNESISFSSELITDNELVNYDYTVDNMGYYTFNLNNSNINKPSIVNPNTDFYDFDYKIELVLIVDIEFNTINSDGFTNKTTQIFSYPINQENITTVIGGSTYQNNILQYNENINLRNINFNGQQVNGCKLTSNSYTCKAWNDITIDGNLTVGNGFNVKIEAGNQINQLNSSIVSPEIILSIVPVLNYSQPMPKADQTYVTSFCSATSNEYQARNPSTKILSALAEEEARKKQSQNTDNLTWDFNLYPNPTTKETNLTFNGNFNESLEIHVFDVTGSEVLNSSVYNENRTSIDVSTLNKGLYFVGVISNGVTKTKQLIIQ